MIIQHMFMTAEQMNQFEILCGVNTMLTGDENLKWSLNCHTERNMMYGGIIRTRFNVTMIDFESPARVFENITTLYQDAANPKSIMTRVQQVTNATIRFTRRCRHSTRHLVMMSNFQTAPFGMIKTETLERRLCPQSDRFQDRVVYYALPINVTKSTSQATTRSRSLRRRLTVPIRALYSFGVNTGAIHLPDLLKEFEKRTNHLRKVRKQLQLTFILDPSRYRLNVLRTRKRSKLTRLSIRKLYQMLHESSKGACQRLEINHRLVGRCKSSVCKLRLRTRYTVNDC